MPSKGYECQVNTTHKDPKKTGSLYGVINILLLAEGQKQPKCGKHIERDKAPSTEGEWFDYHIIVKGREIEIRVNGETTAKLSEARVALIPFIVAGVFLRELLPLRLPTLRARCIMNDGR